MSLLPASMRDQTEYPPLGPAKPRAPGLTAEEARRPMLAWFENGQFEINDRTGKPCGVEPSRMEGLQDAIAGDAWFEEQRAEWMRGGGVVLNRDVYREAQFKATQAKADTPQPKVWFSEPQPPDMWPAHVGVDLASGGDDFDALMQQELKPVKFNKGTELSELDAVMTKCNSAFEAAFNSAAEQVRQNIEAEYPAELRDQVHGAAQVAAKPQAKQNERARAMLEKAQAIANGVHTPKRVHFGG